MPIRYRAHSNENENEITYQDQTGTASLIWYISLSTLSQ